MNDIIFEDIRTKFQKIEDIKKEAEEKFKAFIDYLENIKTSFVVSQENLIKISKSEGRPIFCKYCLNDITFNYDKKKIGKHLEDCKYQLMVNDEQECKADLLRKNEDGETKFED